MDVAVTGVEPLIDDGSYGGYTVVARKLAEVYPDADRNFTRQQIHVWWNRRERNGFPDQLLVKVANGKVKKLFRVSDVVAWFATYTPSVGGRPSS